MDAAAEGALHRSGNRLQHMGHAQGPARSDLQAVDLGDGLHLAHGLGQHGADTRVAFGVLLQWLPGLFTPYQFASLASLFG